MEKRIRLGKSVRRLFSDQMSKKTGTACKPMGSGPKYFFWVYIRS